MPNFARTDAGGGGNARLPRPSHSLPHIDHRGAADGKDDLVDGERGDLGRRGERGGEA